MSAMCMWWEAVICVLPYMKWEVKERLGCSGPAPSHISHCFLWTTQVYEEKALLLPPWCSLLLWWQSGNFHYLSWRGAKTKWCSEEVTGRCQKAYILVPVSHGPAACPWASLFLLGVGSRGEQMVVVDECYPGKWNWPRWSLGILPADT